MPPQPTTVSRPWWKIFPFGTIVENFHPEGSCSGSGSDSSSSYFAATGAPSDSKAYKSGKGVLQQPLIKKIEAKSKPENLKPEPKPTTRKSNGHGEDGTPYPEEFNDWSNLRRLHWLEAHGWHQGSMADTASQKTHGTVVKQAKPTPTATPFAPSPHSESPPEVLPRLPSAQPPKKCARCGGTEPCRDPWCYAYEPVEVKPEPRVPDNRDLLDDHDFETPINGAAFLDGEDEEECLPSINTEISINKRYSLDNWEEL